VARLSWLIVPTVVVLPKHSKFSGNSLLISIGSSVTKNGHHLCGFCVGEFVVDVLLNTMGVGLTDDAAAVEEERRSAADFEAGSAGGDDGVTGGGLG